MYRLVFMLPVLLIPLLNCGPRIIYRYTPPQSAEGRVCINQCSVSRRHCKDLAQERYKTCEYRRELELERYNQCKEDDSKSSCHRPSLCWRQSTNHCDEEFRTCYQACGGQVEAEEQ